MPEKTDNDKYINNNNDLSSLNNHKYQQHGTSSSPNSHNNNYKNYDLQDHRKDNNSSSSSNNNTNNSSKEKVKVAIASIAASVILTLIKLLIGFSTNSLGILSEAMHSGLDVIAAVMTYQTIKVAMRPPDTRYTYGYAKFESISSLVEIVLLFVVAGWVFYEAIERIFFKSVQPEITIFSFAIMFASMGIDYGRSRALYKAARKYGSQALEADGLHFKTDMITSAVVILGLLLVLVLAIPKADAYAALAIAALIIYTSLGLGRRTLDALLDKAPKGVQGQVTELVSGLYGVNKAYDIRARKVGQETFIDMHIEISRTFTHERAHKVATEIEERVKNVIPNSSILVHVDAVKGPDETIIDRVRLIAAETDGIKNVHSIYLSKYLSPSRGPLSSTQPSQERQHQQTSSSSSSPSFTSKEDERERALHLYLDVQMDANLDLKDAHDIADSFERRIKSDIAEIKAVTTHLETEQNANLAVGSEDKDYVVTDQEYMQQICNTAKSVEGVIDCNDIGIITINEDEKHITLTVKVSTSSPSAAVMPRGEHQQPKSTRMTIHEAHRIATYVQNLVMKQTGASRVIVHVEPGEQ